MALLNLGLPGRMKLSTGVLVLYADDESFTLMTPEGHMLAGWITFSAEAGRDVTVVQIQALERTNDPLYELGYVFGGNRLNSLLGPDGREPGPPLRGRQARSTPRSSASTGAASGARPATSPRTRPLRTFVWTLGTPVRWLRPALTRRRAGES